ncbi:MAG: GCN5-related N-acetyltransferase [Ilumatobacteraceae bacterium]|nr:GCN5-related N-acetyltransferase [Ilumatobacteraceae bacterium]
MSDAEKLRGHLNLIEFSRNVARWATMHTVVDEGSVMMFAGSTDLAAFHNGAFRTDDSADPLAVVRKATDFFARRNRGFTFWTRDEPVDRDLRSAVEAAGLTELTRSPQMICRSRPADRSVERVSVSRATTAHDVLALGRLNADAYEPRGIPAAATMSSFERVDRILEPHVGVFLARDDDRVLAGALAMLSHGIGGLFWIATDADARGRGLGAAVTTAAANWCFDHGAADVQLQASAMGRPVYEKLGFELLYHYDVWQH